LVFFVSIPQALALQQVSRSFQMPAEIRGTVTATGCENSPGPYITFNGALALGGLDVRLIFRNNINKDVHVREEEVNVDVVAVPEGGEIILPKQPVRGGVGGNPFIWVQLLDANGSPLSEEIFLGRCVQGTFGVDGTPLFLQALAVAQFEVSDCTNNPGPFINFRGSMALTNGLTARFIFRNNDNPVGGPHEAEGLADLVLLGAGHALQFPKQPVEGGVGGNPWISVQFLGGDGDPIGTESLLGRCVQLLPGN
jgi:hypothetical protein